MENKVRFAIVSMFVVIFMTPIVALSQDAQPDDLRILYGKFIDDVIVHCDAKQIFKDTRSENVRKAVALSVMKGAFLQTYREALVQEMLDEGVRPSAVTVQFFLNDRFHGLMN